MEEKNDFAYINDVAGQNERELVDFVYFMT